MRLDLRAHRSGRQESGLSGGVGMNQKRKGAPEKGAHKINQHGQHSGANPPNQTFPNDDDAFSSQDRAFFTSNPGRNYRLREMLPGEWPAHNDELSLIRRILSS